MTSDRQPLRDQAAYGAAEAARILALPAGTVKAWCFGHDYAQRDGGRKQFQRVIEPADRAGRTLSFVNLCELHLLGVIRRRHGVKLPQVRKALEFLQHRMGVRRPLATQQFLTNGVGLFVEHAGELLNVSQHGQRALADDFAKALDRIRFGDDGRPVQLFPFTREFAAVSEQPRSVLVDPTLSFGRPVVQGANVRTEVIEQRFRAGDTIAEMADDYGVPVPVIEEALRFERRRVA